MDEILISSIRLGLPLLFAAYGGLLSERSGVANIALESLLLFSAFASAAVTAATHSLPLGVAAGVLTAGLIGFAFGVVCIWGRGDQIVVGTAFNLLAVGMIPVACRSFFGVTGSTPSIPIDERFQGPLLFVVFSLIFLFLLWFLFSKTRHGLQIHSAGENPAALATQGINPNMVRLRAVVEGSLIVGLGGIYLSLVQGSGYIRNMSAGRGFIALAALIFGGWKPVPTFLACLFFGLTDAVQMHLQGVEIGGRQIPNQWVQITPYLVTLFVLTFFSRKIRAPKAINQPSA